MEREGGEGGGIEGGGDGERGWRDREGWGWRERVEG